MLIVLATGNTAGDKAGTDNLYVALNGNDTWSGRLAEPNADSSDGPFATLERARDEIRKRKTAASSPSPGSTTVWIRGGLYVRQAPFELAAGDSGTKDAPITYRAAAGETVRLIGGREITNFRPVTDSTVIQRLDESARGKVVQADLKALGVSDLGDVVAAGAKIELFFDDKPMTLARWPNEGFVKVVDVVGGEPMTIHGLKGDRIGKFTYDGDRPKRWEKENDIRLHGYWFWDWSDAYEKVQSIDTGKRVISTVPPYHHYGYRKGQRYYVLNVLAELDSPGEWYVDRPSGVLYFWPPSDVHAGRAYVSVLDRMIVLKDVSYVIISGLCIELNRGHAITIGGGSHNVVAGCTLRNIGGSAIVVTGGTHNGVTGCDIYNTGTGGISLDGGDRIKLAPGQHFAVNNHIHDYSRATRCYNTAVHTAGVGNRVAHNLIHNAPHMAIGLSGNEHVIEFNEVHTVCMETDDAGAFYMGRDWTWRGNIIRNNYFHHIGEFRSNVGVQSVYLDDWASGTTVYGNVIYKGGRGVLVGGGRNNTIENNVFVDCTPAVHVDSRGLGWAKYYFDGKDNTLIHRLNAVPYKLPPWSTKYPELLTLYEDEPALAKYNVVARNICVGGQWLDLRDGLTEEVVQVKDNLVNIDPHFVGADKQNFQLKDDSPAWKLGFRRIPIEKIGPYKDELRATWPVR